MLKIMSFINETYSESVPFHLCTVNSLIKALFFEGFDIFNFAFRNQSFAY